MENIITNRTVSAVISVYNGEKFIGRCLTSILGQTKAFDEIIVYDDASLDETVTIVKEYIYKYNKCKIKLIQSNVNRGPGGGKNYARKEVTSDYFTFIDADDYIGEKYLKNFWDLIIDNEELPDIIFGGFKKTNGEGKVLYTRIWKSKEEALMRGVQNWGNLYKHSFFEKYDINIPGGKVLEDVLTRGVILGCNPVIEIAENSSEYYYVENENSVSHTYMNSFVPGVIELEMNYLDENKYKIRKEQYNLYEYWAYKTMCWHLLKSGAGVGRVAMKKEYERAFELLTKYFPQYKKNIYITRKKPEGERILVYIVLKVIYILEKFGLHKAFLQMYSSINLSFIWPKL